MHLRGYNFYWCPSWYVGHVFNDKLKVFDWKGVDEEMNGSFTPLF
ncbi:Uncharacterised protein [Sporosarcina pasteurii]|uniref:Uncharacterized protein n=1 Tax=Sporosarcina pasteurii TaxID=1474 RepID=A0A380BVI3_SPOPA|nr:Uncharacterised protein [Sporosarcina pasteurii]